MSAVDLDSRPDYDALSYTWGDPLGMRSRSQEKVSQSEWYEQTFEIECDGILVSIGANLYAALISIRWMMSVRDQPYFQGRLEGTPQTKFIWVDQLCINQANADERSSQVSLMGRIYKQADSVVVWLGGEDEYVQDASAIMATLAEKFLRDHRIFDHVRSSGMGLFDEGTYRVLGIPRISVREWIALYAFFSRSWFARAWIVQEISLARKPAVLCGLKLISWSLLFLAVEILRRSGWGSQLDWLGRQAVRDECENAPTATLAQMFPLHKSQPTSGANLVNIWSIFDVKASLGYTEGMIGGRPNVKSYRLLKNITLFRSAQAMDPRDKIYAFMSISREFESDFVAGGEQIQLVPDYRLSPREVFIETAKMMLLSSPALELLSLVQNDGIASTVEDLPSWVPDFSITGYRLPLDFGFPSPFTASNGLGPAHRVFLSPNVLEVRGVCVGVVDLVATFDSAIELSKLADLVSGVPALSAIRLPQMNEGLRYFILESERYDDEENRETVLQSAEYNGAVGYQTRFEVLWRTTPTDSARGRHPLPGHFGPAMCVWMQEIVKKLQVETRDIVLDQGADANKHIDKLAREYTALQQLLGHKPEEERPSPPPEFKRFLDASQSRSNFSLGTAKQEHDRMLKLDRSMDQVDESAMQDVQSKVSELRTQSLFRTCSGEIGLGSRLVDAGDEVWVLAGGNVPYVLRRVDDGQYRLVKECYVHGVMHGEAVANAYESCTTIQIL